MHELIDQILRTMDTIQVSGRENMDRFLGCMLTLKKISDALKEQEAKQNENDHPG